MGGASKGLGCVLAGRCGRKAIMTTTVAVESVVLKHLAHQLHTLRDVDEEQHHHDQSAAQIDVNDPWFKVLTPVVTAWTEAVIWMGMRS